jgi:hypothetical protein
MEPSGPVQGLLYLFIIIYVGDKQNYKLQRHVTLTKNNVICSEMNMLICYTIQWGLGRQSKERKNYVIYFTLCISLISLY